MKEALVKPGRVLISRIIGPFSVKIMSVLEYPLHPIKK
jgi:hypothetical protein